MAAIIVHQPDGTRHDLTGESGQPLMEPLRNAGLVEATCGGAASCGTCHVFMHGDWATKTGERTEDEGYMLEALEEIVEVRESSRLACQVLMADALDGIEMDIAPQI